MLAEPYISCCHRGAPARILACRLPRGTVAMGETFDMQGKRAEHPDRPVALIGHSMGGIVAARYAQLYGEELAALVLSGPPLGGNPAFEALLEMDPFPDIPIDPEVLSRNPEVGRAYAEDP